MNGDRWYSPGDAELYRAIRRVWSLGHRTIRQHFPPGVYRLRNIEEMNVLQARWDDANFEAYRQRLAAASERPADEDDSR
jgi:hypothetical protein